jgi:hypothetical protein
MVTHGEVHRAILTKDHRLHFSYNESIRLLVIIVVRDQRRRYPVELKFPSFAYWQASDPKWASGVDLAFKLAREGDVVREREQQGRAVVRILKYRPELTVELVGIGGS